MGEYILGILTYCPDRSCFNNVIEIGCDKGVKVLVCIPSADRCKSKGF
ncbi:MAG: hypothetical protein A4E42_01014 [Methanoregulaceae archaeon PtaU1.Bin222]|nr:MAG: hypothetical protein A4E42_01014 [Methanoregulaceae archaeon PtaU1.Bin222]